MKRYNPSWYETDTDIKAYMYESDTGEYVKFEDYFRLKDRYDELLMEIKKTLISIFSKY